jgi:hypothetical protein
VTIPGDGRAPDERDRPGPARSHPGLPDPQAPDAPPSDQQAYRTPYDPAPGAESPYGQPSVAGPTGGAAADLPYVYNPYGNYPYPASYPTSPAGMGAEPVLPPRRPGSLHLALLLVVLSAVPYLLVGLLAVAGASQAATALPPEDLAQIQELGIDLAQVVRLTGFVMLAVALGFVLLGVLAWGGRRWARALLAATTVGFVLMVVASVLAAGSQGLPLNAGSGAVLGVPLILALAGVGLMFSSAARDWFARRR